MTMFGNMAISGVIEKLFKLLEQNKELSPEEKLKLLVVEMKGIKAACDSGWY